MWPNTFTEAILNGKPHFLYSDGKLYMTLRNMKFPTPNITVVNLSTTWIRC